MGGQYSHLVFQPTEESSYDESLEGLEWVDISLSPSEMEENQETQTTSPPTSPTDNKETARMPIIYFEWKSKEGDKAQHTLLYSPTTTGQTDMGKHISWLKILRDTLHVNVLCYEYSGYGLFRSSKPSEKHCYENIRAAYNFLTITKQIPSNQIVLMGKALGCGPVVNLASNLYLAFESTKSVKRSLARKVMRSVTTKELSLFRGFAGVVLQSPMTSVIDLSSDSKFSFIGQITNNMFEVIDKVGKIRCPIFILHGSADDVIEISHSQKIAKTAAANLWKFFVIESGGHSNLETEFDDEFLEEFVNFIQSLTPSSHSKLKRSPSMVPAQYVSPDQVLNRWLSSFGCEKYGSLFIGGGYCDMLVVRGMDQVDLDILAITEQTDRDTLLSEISKLKEMDPETVQQMSIFWEEETPRERKQSTSSTGSSSLLEEDEEIAEIRRRVSNADIIETRRDKERRVSNADVIKEAGRKKKQGETIDVVTRKRSNSDEGKKKLGREDRHESITHFIRTRFKRDKSKKSLNGSTTGTGSSSSSSNTSSSIDSLYGGTTGSMDMKAMLSLASSGLGLDTSSEGGSLKLSNSPSNSPRPLRQSRRLSVSDSPSLDLDRHLSDI